MMIKIYRITMICVVGMFSNCTTTIDPYRLMIDYMLEDSTLLNELSCQPCDQITEYSVHTFVNSTAWGYPATRCLRELENYDSIIDFWFINRNKIIPELGNYSNAEVADYHIFFNERVENVQAMFVFFRDAKMKRPFITTDLMYEKPYDLIWRFNVGAIYVFEFSEKNDRIVNVCKEIHQYG